MPCRGTGCHKLLEPARLLHGSYFGAISTNHGEGQARGQGGEGLSRGGRKMKEFIKKEGDKKKKKHREVAGCEWPESNGRGENLG